MNPTFTTRWLYYNLEAKAVAAGRHTCAVCGLPCRDVVPLRKVLRSTFTNYDLLRKPDEAGACLSCAWYFDHQELRRTGWYLTATEARAMQKSDWLSLLREHHKNGVPEDAYYLVKPLGLVGKHLALYAPMVMAGRSSVCVVQFNTMRVQCDAAFWRLLDAAHALRERHSWKEIRTGDYYAKHILAWPDRAEFVRLRSIVQAWRRTPQLMLVEFLWSKPKQEE